MRDTNEGNSMIIYFDDLKEAPPPRKGVKRTMDGLVSKLVAKLKGPNAAYWAKEYVRHTMEVIDDCRMHGTSCWDETSKMSMGESAWNPKNK